MRLTVRHATSYAYGAPVYYSVQRLYLTPLPHDGQTIVSWEIDAPGMAGALRYRDGFGNIVHLLTSSGRHDRVTIVAHGVVECANTAGVIRGLPLGVPNAIFLRQSAATRPSAAIVALAAEADTAAAEVLDKLHALMRAVSRRVAYVGGVTDSWTTAAEALEQGRGVCQDHAHVFLSAARHLGIPSRFVTGYLVTGIGASSQAGHAWAEALVPDLGWVGFDPANGQSPTDQYIRVASGLDAAGVTPVKGSRRGGASERMSVDVSVTSGEQ